MKPIRSITLETLRPVYTTTGIETCSVTISLRCGDRDTVATQKLRDGLTDDGATVVRRKKGFTDYQTINLLVKVGLLEQKHAGPRGGVRYFTTESGRNALELLNS